MTLRHGGREEGERSVFGALSSKEEPKKELRETEASYLTTQTAYPPSTQVNPNSQTASKAVSRQLRNMNATAGAEALPQLPEPPIFDAPFNPYYGALAHALEGMNATQKAKLQPYIVQQILKASRDKSSQLSHVVVGGFALVLVFSLVLLAYIRHFRLRAMKGDAEAARKIILPAFEPMLWVLAGLSAIYVVFFTASIRADFNTVSLTVVTIECFYAAKQFLYLLVPIYLLQSSLSVPALVRSLVINLVASCYTIPVCWVMYAYGKDYAYQWVFYFGLFGARWMLFIPMFYYCIRPPSRANLRAIREYAFYYFVTHTWYFVNAEFFRQGDMHTALTLSWFAICWNATCPFFIWRLLKADTEHWRGIGKRAVELQSHFRRKGKIEERISAKGLHVLIELHRKHIIDFAHLDIQQKISESDSATVFRGKLNTKQVPVAIKVYTPETFDEETVAEFSHEAALCGALRHPNVVTFYGMCVCPPTICLVTELCQGSLQDVTRAMAKKTSQNPHRQQFLINIGYMLDAARAIAYLHSFSPAFVHCDIKPASFLVDSDGSVKLTDFGASRTLSARSTSGHQHEHEAPATMIATTTTTAADGSKKKVLIAPPGAIAGVGGGLAEIMGSLKGSNPEYMAPEVIRSKHAGTSKYGEAADIYALAMTMWDILYPGASKYDSSIRSVASTANTTADRDDYNRRESGIFESVFAGQRPHLDEAMYPPLRELIQTAWHSDPRMRPSAQNIVSVLETIQEEICAVYAMELIEVLECGLAHANTTTSRSGSIQRSRLGDLSAINFPGSCAIEKMHALEHFSGEHEAVRIGNMLMDAGFLHHIKHAHSFEYSAALFFFDEEQIHLCQPLAILEEGAVSTEQETSTEMTGGRPRHAQEGRSRQIGRGAHDSDASSTHVPQRGRCAHESSNHGSVMMNNLTSKICICRKLGQKTVSAQTTRRGLRMKWRLADENHVTARLLAGDHVTESGDWADSAYNRMGQVA